MKTKANLNKKTILLASLAWIASVVFASQVWAADYSFAPSATATQKDLVHSLDRGDFRQALIQYSKAFDGTAFAQSATGYAFYSYLLYRNEMSYIGLEHLFQLTNPELIAPQLKQLWHQAASASHPVWKVVDVRWTPEWRKIFSDVNDGAYLEWHTALAEGVQNQTGLAEKRLQNLLSEKQNLVSRDELLMDLARLYFQDGKLNEALATYKQIPKQSDFWLDSLEERAWTELRMNEPGKALGELQTLLIPDFAPQVGPESYFLQAFTDLKICDYPGVLQTINTFKQRIRGHLTEMEALSKTGRTPRAEAAIAKLENGPLEWNSLGADAEALPRYVHRDAVVKSEVLTLRALTHDLGIFTQVREQSPGILASGTLSAKRLGKLVSNGETRFPQTKEKIFSRLRILAQADVQEISKNIQKFHIAEAEVIERIHAQQVAANRGREQKDAGGADVLRFPYNGEVWVDELDHYNVKVKDCPGLEGKAL